MRSIIFPYPRRAVCVCSGNILTRFKVRLMNKINWENYLYDLHIMYACRWVCIVSNDRRYNILFVDFQCTHFGE